MNKLFLLTVLISSTVFAGVRVINKANAPISFKYLFKPVIGDEKWVEIKEIKPNADSWNTEDTIFDSKLEYQVFSGQKQVLSQKASETGNRAITVTNEGGKWQLKSELGGIKGETPKEIEEAFKKAGTKDSTGFTPKTGWGY